MAETNSAVMPKPTLSSVSLTTTRTSTNNIHDVSFSSYLNSDDEAFVRRLVGARQGFNACGEYHSQSGKKSEVEDGEIGVFGAEKYFNGEMDVEGCRRRPEPVPGKYESKNGGCHGSSKDAVCSADFKIHPATPRTRSESSWNSQRSLLPSVLRSTSQRKTYKPRGKSLLSGVVCRCSCSDKESVHVNENHSSISDKASEIPGKQTIKELETSLDMDCKLGSGSWNDNPSTGVRNKNSFQFPSPISGNLPVKMGLQETEELKPWRSIDYMFGSLDKRNNSMNNESRQTIFSHDTSHVNDNDSDASSDLFEIDSFAERVNPFLARTRSGDTSGSVTQTTYYAPSEASIDWSVVTASAADFSVASDYEELKHPKLPYHQTKKAARATRGVQRCQSSTLLGCKSHKAVKVVGNAQRKLTFT